MKKYILLLLVTITLTISTQAQTYLINGVTGNGNFNAVSAATTWTFANGSNNFWEIGTLAPAPFSATKSAYIRTSGGVYAYATNSTRKNYLYSAVDYTIPASAACGYLSFWYKGNGELNLDYLSVY